RLLFFVQSGQPGNTGVYAASLTKPGNRILLVRTDANAVYAPAGDGKSYLLWVRGGTLVAQEFDAEALKLGGEARSVAGPGARSALAGIHVAVAAGGTLLYSASSLSSQFTWFDHAGKPMGVAGEAGEYSYFRLSPDGRRVAVTRLGPGD